MEEYLKYGARYRKFYESLSTCSDDLILLSRLTIIIVTYTCDVEFTNKFRFLMSTLENVQEKELERALKI